MTAQAIAPEEMRRCLGVAPQRTSEGWRLTAERWQHGELHDRTQAMSEHVLMTYFGPPRRIEWRAGGLGRTGATRPGSVTLIPAGEEARWDINGDLDALHVYVPPEALRSLAAEQGATAPGLRPLVAASDPAGGHLLSLVALEMDRPGAMSALYRDQLCDLLCLHLLRLAGTTPAHARGGLTSRAGREVRDLLDASLEADVGLDALAAAAGLSRSQFHRAFRVSEGMSPMAYLTARRMERARELLAGTHEPVTEIAARCGYPRPDHFATAFKRATGTTPRDFRRDRTS